jgi:uncharacterized protein
MAVDTSENYQIPEPRMATVADRMVMPDNPPWNGWVAIGVWALSVLLVAFVPLLFILPYIASPANRTIDRTHLKEFVTSDPTAVILGVISILPVHAITLLVAWLVVTKGRRFPFWQTLGNKWGGYRWWHFVGIIVGLYAITAIVTYFFPEQDNDLLRMLRTSRAVVYLVAFFATFTAPIVEEVVYRGILYSAFQRFIGKFLSVVVVASLFAGVHFFQYWGSPGTIIVICILSLVLTIIRAQSGNLLPCITLHMIFNGLQSITLLLQPFLETPTQPAPDPAGLIYHLFK